MGTNAVYYTVGGLGIYSIMLMESIASLDRSNPIHYDVIINTSQEYKDEYFNNYCRPNTYFNIVEKAKTGDDVCFNKMKIFDYPEISKYDCLIYFDSDVLINYDISNLFEQCYDDVLYAAVEDYNIDNHNRLQFSIESYSDKELDFFRQNQIYTFNAGVFMLKNSKLMKSHFESIYKNMIRFQKLVNRPFFSDQAFLNQYFNTGNLINNEVILKVDPENRLFRKQILQYVVDSNFYSIEDYSNKIFHLLGNTYDGWSKFDKFMQFSYRLRSAYAKRPNA